MTEHRSIVDIALAAFVTLMAFGSSIVVFAHLVG